MQYQICCYEFLPCRVYVTLNPNNSLLTTKKQTLNVVFHLYHIRLVNFSLHTSTVQNTLCPGQDYWLCCSPVQLQNYAFIFLIKATTMKLLVSHHPPAPNFFQQHAASLFSYLHMISIVLQNLVLLGCQPITCFIEQAAQCSLQCKARFVSKCSKCTTVAVQAEKVQDTKTVNLLFILSVLHSGE